MGHLCLLDHFISTSKSVMNMRKSVSFLVSSQCYNNWATSSFFAYTSWQQPCDNSRRVLQWKLRHSCALAYVTGKVKGRGLNLNVPISRLKNYSHYDLFVLVSITSFDSFSPGTWIRLPMYAYCMCLSGSSHITTVTFSFTKETTFNLYLAQVIKAFR